ncbi:MAG: SDR family oxidoreductase [Deltaproteobacteria bacterium]|nr:SDR family oxidoreductase [Deltaproteobacteria bacterium]
MGLPAACPDRPVALVTGASWGIGLACTELLAANGYRVFGTSRRPKAPANHRVEMLEMEAGSDESVRRCVREITECAHHLDVLIYSIGDGIGGAVEEVALADAEPVFEANFWGAARVTQAILPMMREQRHGRLVYMSSMGGVIGIPFRGFYAASKFALEGFAEALRYEVAPFGIGVSIVEPPGVRTPAADHVRAASRKLDAYQKIEEPFTARFDEAMRNGMPPERVARAILSVLSRKAPPLRIAIGAQARSLSILRRAMPQHYFEQIVQRIFVSD